MKISQENLISTFHPELVSNMPRLHHLNLSHNVLEEFSDETFVKNEELLSLDVSYNRFEEFSELTFKGLEVLEVRTMQTIKRPPLSYQVSSFYANILYILQVFNASHNFIKGIDSTAFTELTKLRILDLGNNQITHLTDKTFTSMTLLKSIKLNNNSLMSIDDAVFSDLKLRRLDLSCNHLSNDNFLWPSSVNIEYLNLTFNEFKLINASVLENTITEFWGKVLRVFLCGKPQS